MKGRESFYYTWNRQDRAKGEAADFFCEELDDFHFILTSGRKVLDLSSISCQAGFGHRPQFIHRAIEKQLASFPMHSPKADFILKQTVSDGLIDLVDQAQEGKIFYCVSGAESIENAIKMARLMTGKKTIVAGPKCYHGASLGASSISGDWRGEKPLTVDNWTLRLPPYDADPEGRGAYRVITAYGPAKVAAICLETVTAVSGVVVPSSGWYKRVGEICEEFNIKLILDEVACGFYRTVRPFAFQHYAGLRPNFVCMAKAITGGTIPFGAIWTDESVATYFEREVLYAGLTNYAHPLGLAACKAVLEYVQTPSFRGRLAENEAIFTQGLASIGHLGRVQDIRQIGMMAAIDYRGKLTWRDFINGGIYLIIKDGQIFLAPPLNISGELLEQGMESIQRVMAKASN